MLHYSVEKALNPQREVAVRRLHCIIIEKLLFRCHSVLSSHVTDLPKTEDLFFLKRETQTNLPCHRCTAPRSSLSETIHAEKRRSRASRDFLKANWTDNKQYEPLKEQSMHHMLPVLATFPLVGIDTCNDIYTTFRFEPMRNFSLSISGMLFGCLIEMVSDDGRVTSTITAPL